jgi:hypothetical protein
MAARPLKRIKSPDFIELHESLRVAKTMNRRFILGIFEHIGIDLRPSVKTLLSKIETGSRSMVPHDARPHFARLPFVIG